MTEQVSLPRGLVSELKAAADKYYQSRLNEAIQFYKDTSLVTWKPDEIVPPVGREKDDLPPLTLDDTRKRYHGHHAWAYDHDNREGSDKWNAENKAVAQALDGVAGFDAMLQAVRGVIRPERADLVLDIPCGTGRFFALYRERGLPFIGMDVSDDMMSQARQKDMDADVRFGDIHDIPLADKSVDTSVCIRMLNLMTEDEMVKAVAELGRVTRSNIICSLFTSDRQIRNKRAWVHRETVFLDALASAGFKPRRRYELPRQYYHVWHCEAA